MKPAKIHIVLNPASAGGRTGRHQQRILRAIERHISNAYRLHVTTGPLDATVLARSAVEEGAEHIIVVGGDGTIQETVNGILCDGHTHTPPCTLGIISSGTGQGFAQSLGLPSGFEDRVATACNGVPWAVDVGRISTNNNGRRRLISYFVNEAQLGLGASVVRTVQFRQKRLGGLLAFGWGTLVTALRENAHPFVISIDGGPESRESLIGLVIANGTYTGGGMNIAPDAVLDDGMMDILLMHDQSAWERIGNFAKVYSGRHTASDGFSCVQARTLTVGPASEILLAADGELLGSAPCEIDVLPRALVVKTTV